MKVTSIIEPAQPATISRGSELMALLRPSGATSVRPPGAVKLVFKPGKPMRATGPRMVARKIAIFRLEAPYARQVKLAADFTDWGQLPLTLERDAHGVWEIRVPLARGRYAYRFIVDGQWQDDPHCTQRENNPFGTSNAVIHVD